MLDLWGDHAPSLCNGVTNLVPVVTNMKKVRYFLWGANGAAREAECVMVLFSYIG
jgi:hypothetical protein